MAKRRQKKDPGDHQVGLRKGQHFSSAIGTISKGLGHGQIHVQVADLPKGLLVWGFFCQEVLAERPIFFPSSVSLFDLKARLFIPTRHSGKLTRAGAVKAGRLFGDHPQGLALKVPSTAAPSNAVGLSQQETIRGSPRSSADLSRHNLVFGGSKDPNHDAVMRIGAKLRSGGPILCCGVISHGVHRVTATSNRHRRPVTSGRARPKLLGAFWVLRSLCGTQNDAVRHHALPHEPPQGDQKLARQGHDHGLASAAGVVGTGSEPLRQGAVILEHEKSHANWIMPRRTRGFPDRASPFSRRFFPLSSGEPVRPA